MGGEQGELFPDDRYEPRLARRTDPETSHQAAIRTRVRLGRLQGRMLEQFSEGRVRTSEEAANDAAEKYGGRPDSYRKRTRELVGHGMLEKMEEYRKCLVTGHVAATYRAKDSS